MGAADWGPSSISSNLYISNHFYINCTSICQPYWEFHWYWYHRHNSLFLILKSMLTCITQGYHWIASSKSMLTWITTIIVFSWFWKVCWLVSPRGIAELLHPKVCWLVSPRGITELLHPKVCWLESPTWLVFYILKSMSTCITRGYHGIASSKIMLTWITDIVVFSWFWKVCWLVSPMSITELLHPKVCWLESPT